MVENADVILFIGARTNQNGTDNWTLFPEGARYIHLDIDSAEVGRNYEALRLVGDARLTLEALIAALEKRDLDRPRRGAGRGREAGPRRRRRLAQPRSPRPSRRIGARSGPSA